MLLPLPRVVLAGVASSVGKTTITTAFIANAPASVFQAVPC
jgi:cobyrinic acid a,c-diamide synthase